MILFCLACLGGLGLLIWSADRFVAGAAALAGYMGMPMLLVGMVIIGFGTSMPEILLSLLAAMEEKGGLALGNAYGSNIANIGLILGIAALFIPIRASRRVIWRETPVLIAVTLLTILQLADGQLGRQDSLILLGSFAALTALAIRRAMRLKDDKPALQTGSTPNLNRNLAWMNTLGGLMLLIMSAKLLVWGAIGIAEVMQVSEVLIGLTMVALGTSLPELASTLTAIRRAQHEMAIGSIIGSNLFNTLVVVGIAGVISPITTEPELLQRDLPVMAGFTLALFAFVYRRRGDGRINRLEASALLAGYTGYIALLGTAAFAAG